MAPNVMIDLSRTSGPAEPGLHRVRLTQMEPKDGQSGFPYIACTYTIEEPSIDNGKTVWDNLSLSPKARFRLEPWLDAVGAPQKGKIDPRRYVGTAIWAVLDHDEYNGQIKAIITEYLSEERAATHTEHSERFSELNGEMGATPQFFNPDDEDDEDEEVLVNTEDIEEFKGEDVPF